MEEQEDEQKVKKEEDEDDYPRGGSGQKAVERKRRTAKPPAELNARYGAVKEVQTERRKSERARQGPPRGFNRRGA